MKYGWKVEEIELKKDGLKKNKTPDSSLKIFLYQRMLRDFSLTGNNGKCMIAESIFFKAVDNFDIKYFDNPFFKTISYIAPLLNEFDFSHNTQFSKSDNPDNIVKYSKDFYKRIDKGNISYFKQFTSDPSRIQFLEDNGCNNFNGRSYIVNSSEYYVLVNFRNRIQDIVTFYHEGKHIENVLKGYNEGIGLYQELPSILYSHYMLDYLELMGENLSETQAVRKDMLSKYCELIKTIDTRVNFIKKLKTDPNFYDNIKQNYNIYFDDNDLYDIYLILQRGLSEKVIGNVLSFLVSIYIYLNSSVSNASNAVSLYMFGMHKMKPTMIDDVIKYMRDVLNQSNNVKNNEKVKK